MPSLDPILEKFTLKFQNQAPREEDKLKDISEKGKARKAIYETLARWEFEGTNFYLKLEEKLRQHKGSCNSHALKQT